MSSCPLKNEPGSTLQKAVLYVLVQCNLQLLRYCNLHRTCTVEVWMQRATSGNRTTRVRVLAHEYSTLECYSTTVVLVVRLLSG
jgi:hypothetical protein